MGMFERSGQSAAEVAYSVRAENARRKRRADEFCTSTSGARPGPDQRLLLGWLHDGVGGESLI